MQVLIYQGTSDFRDLTRDDFAGLGIDHFGMRFTKGVPVEVSNEAYGILLGHPALGGDFAAPDETTIAPPAEVDLTPLTGNPGEQTLSPEEVQKSKNAEAAAQEALRLDADSSGDDDAAEKPSKAKAKRAS